VIKLRFILGLLVILGLSGTRSAPTVRAVNATGLLLEWEGPAYRLTTVVGDGGQIYSRVEAEGYLNGGAPGWPGLPSRGSLVALPPGGDFGLELIEVAYDTVPLDHPIEPAPAPAPLQFDADGQPLPGDWTFARDETAYASATPHPDEFAAPSEAVWMRDHRLVRLTFTPFRYHPARQTLDVVRRLRLRVWWEPPTSPSPAAPRNDTFQDVLANLVLNPTDLDAFRARDRLAGISAYPRSSASQVPGPYKALVTSEGIYALDYSTLAAAGLPLGNIDPSTLRLIHGGSEVAARWEGDGDTAFEHGERLLFYARPQLTRYAGYDVYWLAWGGDAGQRMVARSGDPAGLPAGTAWATALAEENVEYNSLYQGRDGDRWFWRRLKLPDLSSDTFAISLETPAAATPGELTVWLRGLTSVTPNPDHHVHFSLNEDDVGDGWWEGKTAYTATLSLPAGLLRAGSNEVGLSLPGDTGTDIEGALVDAIAITYGLEAVDGDVARFRGQSNASAYTVGGFFGESLHVYDVTDPTAPLLVTGVTPAGGVVSVGDGDTTPAEYLVLTDDQIRTPQAVVPVKSLSDPPGGADYLIITHPDFEAALAPLSAHRGGQGLRVVTVDVEAIYDRFGDGRMDPAAIRAFLSHAYAKWPGPAPRYVLLVGDGTYDPRHYRPDTNPTYLPPYLADVDPWLGETTSDNRYADLTGDLLPEVRLGRFPVNTPHEAEAIVEKIIRYESDPLPGGWNGRLLFGADNPSDAGNHHADADSEFSTYATPAYGYEGVRVYLSATAGDPHLYTDAEAARDALIAELNRGALLYSYFGHASWHQEAVLETDNYAPLFHQDDIPRLSNRRRWPMVLQMTCFTGSYIQPADDTLDESLLRADGIGAAAVWGASGLGVATGHRVLHQSFYQAVFDDGQAELGAATHAALINLYASGLYNDLIDTYHLFGDPAQVLNMTIVDWPFSAFLPIITQGP
jgi:hypothetical protein